MWQGAEMPRRLLVAKAKFAERNGQSSRSGIPSILLFASLWTLQARMHFNEGSLKRICMAGMLRLGLGGTAAEL